MKRPDRRIRVHDDLLPPGLTASAGGPASIILASRATAPRRYNILVDIPGVTPAFLRKRGRAHGPG
jgi:hypothetical protein